MVEKEAGPTARNLLCKECRKMLQHRHEWCHIRFKIHQPIVVHQKNARQSSVEGCAVSRVSRKR
jgi:hypothetical protein